MEHTQNRDPWEQRDIEGKIGQPGVPDWTMLPPFAAIFRPTDQPIQSLTPPEWDLARGAYVLLSNRWQRPALIADLHCRMVGVALRLRQKAKALSSKGMRGPTPMNPA